MKKVDLDGTEICYLDEGEGVPIVLVHGFSSNAKTNWLHPGWVKVLNEANFRVIALDNRGHGGSSKYYHENDYSLELMAGDVANLIDYLNVSNPHIMGYSMGARISVTLAHIHSQRIGKLIIAGNGYNMIDGGFDTDVVRQALLADTVEEAEEGVDERNIDRQLLEVHAREVRLKAERDGAEHLEIPVPFRHQAIAPGWTADLIRGQIALFDARRASFEKETSAVREQQEQITAQISGLEAQRNAMAMEIELLDDAIADQAALLSQGLATRSKQTALQRDRIRLVGETGRLTAAIGEARGRIASLHLHILRLHDKRREDAISQLRDLQFSAIELEERWAQTEQRLADLEITAPAAGVIVGTPLMVRQAVIRPAQTIMTIVPASGPIHVVADIDPSDIDEIYVGQIATLKLSAFDLRMVPEVRGKVEKISPDTTESTSTGSPIYRVTISFSGSQSDLEQQEILPGMPVDVFLTTKSQTVLQYLTKPLAIYFDRALRES